MVQPCNVFHWTSVLLFRQREKSERSPARLIRVMLVGLGSFALILLMQLAMSVITSGQDLQPAPPAQPLSDAITGVITVQHSISTTHQMVVFGNGRITNRFLTDDGHNQIDQDGKDDDATTIAVLFDQHPQFPGYTVDVGVDGDFYTTNLITLNDPSSLPGYSEDSHVIYASKTLSYQITQRTLTQDTGDGDWLIMDLIIRNIGDTPLTGGKLLLMVNIDVGHKNLNDEGGYNSNRSLVYQTDFSNKTNKGFGMGVSLLKGDLAGYGVDGNNYPATDSEKISEMRTPRNTINDGNNDVSWLVANVPTLQPDEETRLSFGLCAKTGNFEDEALINLINCISGIDVTPLQVIVSDSEPVKLSKPPQKIDPLTAFKFIQDDVLTSTSTVIDTFSERTITDSIPNGNFERGDLNGWITGQGPFQGHGSGLPQKVVDFEGNYRALLGDPSAQNGAIPVGYGYIARTFTVQKRYLRLRYRVLTHDLVRGSSSKGFFDTFEVSLNVSPDQISDTERHNKGCPSTFLSPTDNITPTNGLIFCGGFDGSQQDINTLHDLGWRTAILDLQKFQGDDDITLYLTLWSREYQHDYIDDQGNYNTWVYIDDIQFTDILPEFSDTHSPNIEYNPVLDIEIDGPSKVYVGETSVITFSMTHTDASDDSSVSNIIVVDDVAGIANYVDGDDNNDDLLDVRETWIYTVNHIPQPDALNQFAHVITVAGKSPNGRTISASNNYSSNICISDDFSDSNSGWDISSGPSTILEYISGEYRMFPQYGGVLHWTKSPVGPYTDYTLQVEARWHRETPVGDEYGLVFDLSVHNDLAMYRFNIDPSKRTYVLGRLLNGKWEDIVSKFSPDIEGEPFDVNKLKVARKGDRIELYINEVYQTDYISSELSRPGYLGLNVLPSITGDGDVRFDNFEVCRQAELRTSNQINEPKDSGQSTNIIAYNPILDIDIDDLTVDEIDETIVYTFTISHADASDGSPVSDLIVKDDLVGMASHVTGDDDDDGMLDANEQWVYTLSHTIQPADLDLLVRAILFEGIDQDGNRIMDFKAYTFEIGATSIVDDLKNDITAYVLLVIALVLAVNYYTDSRRHQLLTQLAIYPNKVYELLYGKRYRLLRRPLYKLLSEKLRLIDTTADAVMRTFFELHQNKRITSKDEALVNWQNTLIQRERTKPSCLGEALLSFQTVLESLRETAITDLEKLNFKIDKGTTSIIFTYGDKTTALETWLLHPKLATALEVLGTVVELMKQHNVQTEIREALSSLNQASEMLADIIQLTDALAGPEAIATKMTADYLLASLKQEKLQSQLEMVRSAYIVGRPITDPELFIGRDDVMRRILYVVQEDSVMVYGPRRIGKTSVLHQLKHRLSQPTLGYKFISVFINLQATSEIDFFTTVIELTLAQIIQEKIERPELRLDRKSSEYTYHDCLFDLREIMRVIKNRWPDLQTRLVWLFDEVDTLLGSNQLLQVKLRTVIQDPDIAPYLRFILAGVQPLKDLDDYGSPFYNIFTKVELHSLSEPDARRLIVNPVRGQYDYQDEAIDLIIQLSKATPYWMQYLCRETLTLVINQGLYQITTEDVLATLNAMPPEFPGSKRSE